MRKTAKLTGQAGDTETMAAVVPPLQQIEHTAYNLFAVQARSTGNDTCARINSLLQTTHVVVTFELVGIGTCKLIQAIQRGDWLDLKAVNNQGKTFETCVLWHTKFDFYFGMP